MIKITLKIKLKITLKITVKNLVDFWFFVFEIKCFILILKNIKSNPN